MHELVQSGLSVRAAAQAAGHSLEMSANTLHRWYGKVKKQACPD
ncbi:hypothetical protein [Sodalis glossinidius]|nr:hypothetical protein [Sodalis glossinidius]